MLLLLLEHNTEDAFVGNSCPSFLIAKFLLSLFIGTQTPLFTILLAHTTDIVFKRIKTICQLCDTYPTIKSASVCCKKSLINMMGYWSLST
jgi:hypothetical protein